MKKVYIFSYGLHPKQVTLETLAAMRGCGVVYTHCLDEGTAHWFRRMAPGPTLRCGLGRGEAAAAAVSALREHDVVGFLTYGNPLFLNQAAAAVVRAARRAGAEVEVLSGVSSLDALVNLFNLNKYAPCGLRLVDAASSLRAPYFAPRMDTLVFVPDVLNLPGNAAAKRRFITAAQKAYPASAPVYLADCASISGGEHRVIKGRISGLEAIFRKVNERHTLFIPASEGRRPGLLGFFRAEKC